jgi:flagellar hook-associated protein 3 FlgL
MSVGRVTQGTLYREFRASVGRLQRQLADAQAAVSSQKKLRDASDDPIGAAAVTRLRAETRAIGAVRDGIGFGTAVLSAQDGALEQVESLLTRAREIAAQTSSGLTTAAGRQQAAAEVAEIERTVLTLANTTVGGRHVFGGLVAGAHPFADLDAPGFDAATAYGGPTEAFALPIGANQTVAVTTPGDQVFGAAITALDDLRQTLAAGTAPTASVDAIEAAAATIREERASIGGRVARLADRGDELGRTIDGARVLIAGVEDADLTSAITELVQLQNALQATLAAGGSLQTNLLDYLRP